MRKQFFPVLAAPSGHDPVGWPRHQAPTATGKGIKGIKGIKNLTVGGMTPFPGIIGQRPRPAPMRRVQGEAVVGATTIPLPVCPRPARRVGDGGSARRP